MFEQIYGAIQTRSGCRKQTWVKITRTDFMEMSPSTNQVKTARREEPERTASATTTAWCSEVTCNHGIVLENKERKVKKKNSWKIKSHPGVNQSCRCWIEIWFVLTWRFSEPWIDLVTTILVCLVFKCRLKNIYTGKCRNTYRKPTPHSTDMTGWNMWTDVRKKKRWNRRNTVPEGLMFRWTQRQVKCIKGKVTSNKAWPKQEVEEKSKPLNNTKQETDVNLI